MDQFFLRLTKGLYSMQFLSQKMPGGNILGNGLFSESCGHHLAVSYFNVSLFIFVLLLT